MLAAPLRLLALGLAAAWLGSPPRLVAADTLAVGTSEPVDAQVLAAALRLRVDGPVDVRPGAAPADGTWVLDVVGVDAGAQILLRAPDGRSWERPVPLSPRDDAAETARAVALQAGYAATLADAPFALHDLPQGPPGLVPAEPQELGFWVELLSGATGDLWGTARGEDFAVELFGRVGLAWSWGLWAELEAGWQRGLAGGDLDVAIDSAPIRLGIGGQIPLDAWSIRLALQAIVQPWSVSGDTRRASGWRGGAGALVEGTYLVAPWCFVGLGLGLEFLPRAVELDYLDQPILALGQLRWRAGVIVGFRVAGL
jgi:hypothetical protein